MTWGLVPWLAGAVAVTMYVRWHDRREERRWQQERARREADTVRMLAEFDALAADEEPPADPLAELEAELEYVRELVAEVRKERAARTAAPALANPPTAAMVMVPSERS